MNEIIRTKDKYQFMTETAFLTSTVASRSFKVKIC